jgi:hypothetical protein
MTGPADEAWDPARGERRTNRTLRELLDELISLARHLSRRSADMSQVELDYAQQRLEWLADEIWTAAVAGRDEETSE